MSNTMVHHVLRKIDHTGNVLCRTKRLEYMPTKNVCSCPFADILLLRRLADGACLKLCIVLLQHAAMCSALLPRVYAGEGKSGKPDVVSMHDACNVQLATKSNMCS